MKINPMTDRIVSITVQDFNVCGTVILKNSFTIQNPASFTWESTSEPAPVAKTTSSTFALGF